MADIFLISESQVKLYHNLQSNGKSQRCQLKSSNLGIHTPAGEAEAGSLARQRAGATGGEQGRQLGPLQVRTGDPGGQNRASGLRRAARQPAPAGGRTAKRTPPLTPSEKFQSGRVHSRPVCFSRTCAHAARHPAAAERRLGPGATRTGSPSDSDLVANGPGCGH